MSAIPVEYEALQGLRRKTVSLLRILLASAMAMGILVYVDSYSIHEWNNQIGQVGSIDMMIDGDNIANYANAIRNIPEVEQSEVLEYFWGDFQPVNATEYDYWFGGKMIHLTEEYQAAFDKASKADSWEPNDTAILNTLGAAQYRLGYFEDALKALAKAGEILSSAGEDPDPVNVAFTAMALYKIGRIEEAKHGLEKLRDLRKDEIYTLYTYETEVQILLAEAEKLIADEEGK